MNSPGWFHSLVRFSGHFYNRESHFSCARKDGHRSRRATDASGRDSHEGCPCSCDFVPLFSRALVVVLPPAFPRQGLLASPPEGAAAVAESAEPESSANADDNYELLKLFVDTLDQVERNHVQGLSRRELIEAAIAGMLAKLDEHTNYINPDDFERFRAGVENEFPGVGVRLSLEQGRLLIVSAFPDSPAHRAGLGAGDVITHIGDDPTEKLTLDDAVKRLKGPAGTQVTVRVVHPGNATPQSVTLTRELVRVETVRADVRGPDQRWQYMADKDRGIAYVRVVAFGRHTAAELKRVLDELSSQKMRGLILDLRFNPGGLLTSAVAAADLFVTEGRIVSTSGRNVKESIWTAQSCWDLHGLSDGRAGKPIQRQRQRSCRRLPAGSSTGRGRRAADVWQRKRPEHRGTGRGPQRTETDDCQLLSAERQEHRSAGCRQ